MKQSTLIFAMIFLTGWQVIAQKSNLVFYSQQGERFFVILNGIRQNEKAETNVKVTDLVQPYYKLKIIFDNSDLGQIDKNLNFNPGNETVFAVKQNKKGEYIVRWQSEIPLAQAPPPAANQQVVVYHATAAPAPANSTVTVTETTTQTVTSGTAQPAGEGVSMGVTVNDPIMGVNMNINVNDGTGSTMETTSSTTYSSTTTTTSGTGNVIGSAPATEPVQEVYVMPGYNGPVGCPWPMSEQDFNNARSSVSSKSFEDSKLTVARQISGSNCLMASQVRAIMLLFDFEDSRLEFAKYAYGFTFDLGNYYQVNDAFDFESSIDDLNAYINSR